MICNPVRSLFERFTDEAQGFLHPCKDNCKAVFCRQGKTAESITIEWGSVAFGEIVESLSERGQIMAFNH